LESLDLDMESIKRIYETITEYHKNYLNKYGVKLPKLYNKEGKFTKDALVLIYLSNNYPNTKKVEKKELTHFIRRYYPDTNDVQQARHLGAQSGWWIVAGGRDNIVLEIERGTYQLYTLEKPYPGFKKEIRKFNDDDIWKSIKKIYNFRCATCGSKEGEPHFHWPGTITKLQKAHMNPNKPLTEGNIIPQCQKCNRADRNRWVYDKKGRVIKLADARFVKNFDVDVRKKIYKILYKEFNGIHPGQLE